VLIRNAEGLERMEKVDTLVVDKTGTLTEGRPRLVAVVPLGTTSEKELLETAGGLELGSEHPLANAILSGARERGLTPSSAQEFKSVTGKGIRGIVNGMTVALGNAAMMEEMGVDSSAVASRAEELRSTGQTVMFVAIGDRLAGFLAVADPIKDTASSAIKDLQRLGIEVVMVTGDSKATAEAVAHKLNIKRVHADILPAGKIQIIRELQTAGKYVGMAGDGINDAPALAQAQVGIAMGTGTDVAMESATITLLKGDLTGLVRARRLSHATMRNIRQNLFFAFAYNVAGIPIAAGLFYPFTGMLLSPMVAAFAMSLSSVSVIGNSLRLRSIRL